MSDINSDFQYQKCTLSDTGFCKYYSTNDRANCYPCPLYQLQSKIGDNKPHSTFSMEYIRNVCKQEK